MQDALSVSRSHNPRNLVVGFYDPSDDSVTIEQSKRPTLKTMGKGDAQNRLSLLPEEALYMVERGSLDLRWRTEELEGLPLSLQAAYVYLLGKQGLTLERYTVYASLKRIGYAVQRGPAWYPEDYDKDFIPQRELEKPKPLGRFSQFYKSLFDKPLPEPSPPPPSGPLVTPGFYRSYNSIYRLLTLMPAHDPSEPTDRESLRSSASMGHPTSPTHPRIRPAFYVWKPTTDFKKSAPPPPDFRIAVMNAREESFPVLEQLDDLLQSVPYDPPPAGSEGQTIRRVKHGWRNVLLAVVDQGVVSYMRVADAGFGKEKVYESKGRGRGGKRGGFSGRGRGGGRGRGRGRGI